jgi:drug/metabolite transporter (DMT)-like permease
MLALGLGLIAALLWAVHDLLARKLSQETTILPIILLVLAAGSVALIFPSFAWGDWDGLSAPAIALAAAAGLTFSVAIGALYKAFSIAPVRIVSPIVGAYPMISLLIAAMQGRPVTFADWLAVLAVVVGIAIVSFTYAEMGPADQKSPLPAMGWSALSACSFAMTFALGQEAARQGSELPTILITRLVACFSIAVLFLWARPSKGALRGNWWLVAMMGVLDAIALSAVTASGRLPQAEYASVSSSLFGVGTILLASYFLKEQLTALQWAGVATVFAGIAALSLQG